MFLPPPFPEEVVGGYLLRLEREAALHRESLLLMLTGHALHSHSFVLTIYAGLARHCGMSLDAFMRDHTVLPYFTAFMSERDRNHFWDLAQADASPLAASVIARRTTQGQKWLRLCPRCVIEDLGRYGIAYWRRAHHVAGVRVCSVHRCELAVTLVELNRKVPQVLPHEVTVFQRPPNDCSFEALLGIADLTDRALRGELDGVDWPTYYRTTALALGYEYHKVGLMVGVLAKDLARFFGTDFLAECGQSIAPNAKTPWSGRLLQPFSFRTTAFKHILLNVFLDSNPEPSVTKQSHLSRKRPVQIRDWGAIERQAIATLDATLQELLRSGKRIGLAELYRQVGVFNIMKINRANVPGLVAWFERFVLSAAVKKSAINRRKRGDAAKRLTRALRQWY